MKPEDLTCFRSKRRVLNWVSPGFLPDFLLQVSLDTPLIIRSHTYSESLLLCSTLLAVWKHVVCIPQYMSIVNFLCHICFVW
jgi:hypothetical protein